MLLYSLCAHFKQHGCGLMSTYDAGMLVYYSTFVLLVDTSTNCMLLYGPLGAAASLDTFHYVQPRCSPSLYPSELSSSSNKVFTTPALVKDDPPIVPAVQAGDPCPLSTPSPSTAVGLPSPLTSLVDLAHLASQLRGLMDVVLPPSTPPPPPKAPSAPPVLLSTMTLEEITGLLHRPSTSLPVVCPYDTLNSSDTKTH